MENWINSLPKPLLAFIALVAGIIFIMMYSPMHTVCDTQEEALRESQKGTLFPTEVKKSKIPPTIGRAKEACQLGNSAGSCYEYFMVLKKVADEVAKSSSECTTQLYDIKEVSSSLNDGIELMARLAWGTKPPEPGPDRLGWLQEAEMSTFCRLRRVYVRAHGEESWNEMRAKIFKKLPGEEMPYSAEAAVAAVEPKKATAIMTDMDIFNRSIFSVRCDNY